MTASEAIIILKSFDPDAELLIICAKEEDGSLSLTKKIRLEQGSSDDFDGLDDSGDPEFEEKQFVLIMPSEGPWVEGKIDLLEKQ